VTDIEKALEEMFDGEKKSGQSVLKELGSVFTSQEFLRRIIHAEQHAYIRLLVACSHLKIPFDQAHQKIGQRIGVVARQHGYEADQEKQKDENIFRLPTESVIYRRSDE
jgi:hypothetical protein